MRYRKRKPWEKAPLAKFKSEPWRLNDWYEEVSSIVIQPTWRGQKFNFRVIAEGKGSPSQRLIISIVDKPEAQITVGLNYDTLSELGQWCIESGELLSSLNTRKLNEWVRIERQLAKSPDEKNE
jgi:hypothetical protein